jgi:hypothetical protein
MVVSENNFNVEFECDVMYQATVDCTQVDEGAVNAMQIRPELVLPSVSRSKLNNNVLVIKTSDCVLDETIETELFVFETMFLKGVLLIFDKSV